MKLIVGLGNPGRKYEQTRHNVGFTVADRLAARFAAGPSKEKFDGLAAEASIADQRVLLLWPQTMMNRSGRSVGAAVAFYKLEVADLLVVCDDFNLPLGKLRFRSRGSAGGQNGLDDIIGRLGSEEFSRLRIGIGPLPDQWDAADFVLGRFAAGERQTAEEATAQAADAVVCWLTDGVDVCMNRFN
jgi:peptidyl-tRNA hydrolase, PTH1 family